MAGCWSSKKILYLFMSLFLPLFVSHSNAVGCEWITTQVCSPDAEPYGAGCELIAGCYCGDPYYSTSTEVRRRCRSWALTPGEPCSPDCPYCLYDRIEKWSCECMEGDTRSCYYGPEGTLGVGNCTAGVQECTASGQWGPCWYEVWPQTDVCDGMDNDCNGKTDEYCGECYDGQTRSCYGGPDGTEGIGECTGGTQTCVESSWASCSGQTLPQTELCDNKDNDCNGIIDDNPVDNPCCNPCDCMCCEEEGSSSGN